MAGGYGARKSPKVTFYSYNLNQKHLFSMSSVSPILETHFVRITCTGTGPDIDRIQAHKDYYAMCDDLKCQCARHEFVSDGAIDLMGFREGVNAMKKCAADSGKTWAEETETRMIDSTKMIMRPYYGACYCDAKFIEGLSADTMHIPLRIGLDMTLINCSFPRDMHWFRRIGSDPKDVKLKFVFTNYIFGEVIGFVDDELSEHHFINCKRIDGTPYMGPSR